MCLVAAPFIVNAFIGANSRGAMLGLVCAGLVALVISWRSYRSRTILGIVIGLIAIFALSAPKFLARQETTFEYKKDSSATSRLEYWKVAIELIKKRPLGVGGQGYDILAPAYLPKEVTDRYMRPGRGIAVHNTFLLVATEWGIFGLVCFLGFIIASFRRLHRFRRLPARSAVQKRIQLESIALEIAFVGLLAAGFFTNRLYAEAPYWLAGLAAGLSNLWVQEEADVSLQQGEGQNGSPGERLARVG